MGQILPLSPYEGTNPADTLTSDFRGPQNCHSGEGRFWRSSGPRFAVIGYGSLPSSNNSF